MISVISLYLRYYKRQMEQVGYLLVKFQRNVDNHGLGLKLISVFYVRLLYDHSRTTLWLKEKRETKKMSETILELQENASVLKVVSISQQHIQSTIFRYIFLKYRLLPARLHF